MEDPKGAAPRASSSSLAAAAAAPVVALEAPPPPLHPSSSSAAVPASAAPPKEERLPPAAEGQRLRFSVELKPGETTIVSWKRLLKESGKAGGLPPNAAKADPPVAVAAAQVGAVSAPLADELKDAAPPPNRFSAVIEKIERLYMGKQSSDEEDLNDIPDDDQYDTEDSFIDDTELDEYFQVDKMSTKHNGYFVNKGKLEQVEASSSPKEAPKKRRRKDSTKLHGEASHVPFSSDSANASNMRIKDAGRNAPVVGRKLSPAKAYAPYGEHYSEEGRHLKYRSKISTAVHKRKTTDFSTKPEEQTAMVPYKDVPSLPLELKDVDKHKAGAHTYKGTTQSHRSRTSDSFEPSYQASRDKGQVEFHSKKSINGETGAVSAKVRRKEKHGSMDFSSMNSPGNAYPTHAAHQSSTRVREGSSLRPKGTTLERAIRDLEKIVAECRPPSVDVQDVDPAFQGIKRRLPQEVKQKLAKVARLSASQGKISEDELIDRLMGILGHLVQRKTLKKNMREMVELGLSAKQQKADRFQQIKREVNDMVRARVSQLKSQLAEQQDGSADDFQEINVDERRALKGRYSMDAALEDKICDLYDLYVEGMDEDKGPQSRKLYVELAELWPSGYMDNVGIKDAIYRSKERKRSLYRQHKVRDEERVKRKKLASTARVRVDETNSAAQLRAGQERPAPIIDSTAKYLAPLDKLVSSQAAGLTGRSVDSTSLSTESGHHALKHPDKIRGANMSTNHEDVSKPSVDVKKKLKRKLESELGETRVHPDRVLSQQVIEKQKSLKLADEANASCQLKTNLELPGVSGSNQPS
ncbi:ubinuclein-1 [Canna indica]|uniref:Ubinuclein-1 n=1 Tax=Canna indica TaxID=4628 RepID=A0AAQ3JQW9_9LILI|nr:ubinuclein-1 [Canna indica]